ncbi:MAG: CocE/NonD family hydrolase [Deltaproteobacteria bacterium]|nr:CocE/NonD family hydrolase [Deltaproteobacteria bacterium]
MSTSGAALVAALALLTCACGDGGASFKVRESVEQLHLTHASPGAAITLLDGAGQTVQTAVADGLGSAMFRKVPPGSGYTVTTGLETSRRLTVMSVESSQPDTGFYRRQQLKPGFNYLETRDGTTLSAYVTMPGPPEAGPYPTVVEYSGYDPSKPGKPLGDFGFMCEEMPILCDAPSDKGALFAALMGYATVGVNVRGTGCSGGAYEFFETLQLLDGYDVIETVAAQDWVLHNQVGMVGLSYPGITQLFVARTRPPGLAAITPLSVIGNAATTMLPGGILNDGFGINWVKYVLRRAVPYGQGWEQDRVDAGDEACAENQLLHGQLIDTVEQARTTEFYVPEEHDRLNPTTFVHEIQVPVFLAGAWQDEQTGPYFFTLLDKFTGAPAVRFHVYNGVHPDAFGPTVLAEWYAFLELFVARRVPALDPVAVAFVPFAFDEVFGSTLKLPASKWESYASYEEALAAWQAEPPLRVLFESGAALPNDPGAPVPSWEQSFAAWPPPGQRAVRYYLQPDGTLGTDAPTVASAASSFDLDPEAGQRGILAPGGDVWDKLPDYDWRQPPPGSAVVFESAALAEDVVMLGSGSVDLWLRSTADDADLEVNLSEIRPDGQEMYVQSGWLRASYGGLAPDSTDLWPDLTLQEDGWAPLVPGEWRQVRVAIAGFQHVFRAGSRIRLAVDTPGDSRAEWLFALKTFPETVTHTVGHDATHPSSVVLPHLEGVTAPTALPPCPSLRGQQCRDYVAFTNTPAS